MPNVKLSVNSFSLSRGTQDITGSMKIIGSNNSGFWTDTSSLNQVIYPSNAGTRAGFGAGGSSSNYDHISFQASRNWTGSTNSVSPQTSALGSGSALDVTPAYYTVHMWLRLT